MAFCQRNFALYWQWLECASLETQLADEAAWSVFKPIRAQYPMRLSNYGKPTLTVERRLQFFEADKAGCFCRQLCETTDKNITPVTPGSCRLWFRV